MTAEHDTDTPEPRLNSTEIRILGCLIEKQATNPETYPLTQQGHPIVHVTVGAPWEFWPAFS